jgi:hypothetical protein
MVKKMLGVEMVRARGCSEIGQKWSKVAFLFF